MLPLLEQAEEILSPILERLQKEAIAVLGEEWVRSWYVDLPDFTQAPGQVNIPVILWLRNLALAYDMVDYGKMRYNLLGNGGHWCPGQKAEQLSGLDLSSCLKNSPHAAKIPALLAEVEEILGGGEIKRLSQS
ncbi:MAG: hypothetical protein WA865_07020 [Spirulinaceae cyanobacterium]